MTVELVTDIMQEGLFVILKTAAPPRWVPFFIDYSRSLDIK